MTEHHTPEEMRALADKLQSFSAHPEDGDNAAAMLRDIADAAEKDRDGEPKLWGWWKISEPGGVLMVKECPIAWKGMAIPLFTHPKNAAIQPFQQSVHSVSAEKDREDAERYRWLRDAGNATWKPLAKRYMDSCALPTDVDQAIDAARKEK